MSITRHEERRLIEPAMYYEHGYPWDVWAKLRREAPLHRVERDDGESFWAVTKYQDIVDIENNTDVFKNAPKLVMLSSRGMDALRMVVNMDPPEHTAHRALANSHFMPRNIEWVKAYAEEIVTEALDKAMERNGDVVDLQEDVANLVPTAVISAYLGVPRERWPEIVHLTNQVINANDPRLSADAGAETVGAAAARAIFGIHAATFADRRAHPRDDLMTALVQARINGRLLTELELLSWSFILTTAGHETTQSTFTLGVHALLQNPEQLAKLKANMGLLPRAINELIRYISPAIHFAKTASCDVEIRDRKIQAGEHMAMFYPSGNRDEEAFENPDQLDIERFPNRHLAFGTGPHLCIGMHLARMELRVMFEHFLNRVERIEIAGTPENVYTNNTGGYRKFPVRMTVRRRT